MTPKSSSLLRKSALLFFAISLIDPTVPQAAVVDFSLSPVVASSPGEWVQFGHDAQRSNYTSQTVATPWRYKWQWNGAGSDGKTQASHLTVPDLVQPITGGGRVYIVAANTVYALNQSNGSVLWTRGGIGTLNSTAVYDNENLYVASGNNNLYKLNAATGGTLSQFTAASALNLTPLLAGGKLYLVSASGVLSSVDPATMAKSWDYSGGSPGVTPASYSPSRNIVIFLTQDLFVHAVNTSNGTQKWRVKPTPRSYTTASTTSNYTEAINGWPVIAEQHGLVFVRYRLEWDTLWTWNPFPTTNSAIRSNFQSQPNQQALFPLNLDTGAQAFIANAGNGGAGDGGDLPMGPLPVIANLNGTEVAYIIWRNGLTCAASFCDGREDAAMGEMVLDGSTVSGYQAGDVRFVQFADIQTDEMMRLAMSGNTVFHSHWLINAAHTVTNRSSSLGGTFTNPIQTTAAPYVIWRQVYCPPSNSQCNPQIFPGGSGFSYGPSDCPFDAVHRYCSSQLYAYGDQRSYPPGFYEYHNDNNDGNTPYTIISNNLVIVKTGDGALIALENGNPLAGAPVPAPAIQTASKSLSLVADPMTSAPVVITPQDAKNHIGTSVMVKGKIYSVTNRLPKAMYISFSTRHEDSLLVRVFQKDMSKFDYDLKRLEGKSVEVSGFVTLYWPRGKDPEIVISDPSQIRIPDPRDEREVRAVKVSR